MDIVGTVNPGKYSPRITSCWVISRAERRSTVLWRSPWLVLACHPGSFRGNAAVQVRISLFTLRVIFNSYIEQLSTSANNASCSPPCHSSRCALCALPGRLNTLSKCDRLGMHHEAARQWMCPALRRDTRWVQVRPYKERHAGLVPCGHPMSSLRHWALTLIGADFDRFTRVCTCFRCETEEDADNSS